MAEILKHAAFVLGHTDSKFLLREFQVLFFGKDFFKNSFRKELTSAANSAMPQKAVINVMVQKKQNIQTHLTVVDQLTVADQVLQIAYQTQLKKHNGIDALLSAGTIKIFEKGIQKMKIKSIL